MSDEHEVAEGDKVIWKREELDTDADDFARVAGLASVEPEVDEVFDLSGRKLRAVVAPQTAKSDCDLCALRLDLDRCLQVRCEGDLRRDGTYVLLEDVAE